MEPYATSQEVWAGALVFGRVGAILMLIPGVGEAYVPPRVRLSLALLVALVLTPMVALGATLAARLRRHDFVLDTVRL